MELACFICSLATSMPRTSIQAPMNCYLYMCTSICCVPTCILSTTMFILQVFPGIYKMVTWVKQKVSRKNEVIGVVPRLGRKLGTKWKVGMKTTHEKKTKDQLVFSLKLVLKGVPPLVLDLPYFVFWLLFFNKSNPCQNPVTLLKWYLFSSNNTEFCSFLQTCPNWVWNMD